MEKKQSHLGMIQGIVNRLSQNSFLLKGWSVVLVSAMFALAAGNSKEAFVYMAYFPAAAFWILDGYFLWQERLFRALYDHVRKLDEEEIDFAMDTRVAQEGVAGWLAAVFSRSILMFHGTVLGSIIIVMLLITFLN